MKKIIILCQVIFIGACIQAQTLSGDIKFFKVETWETIDTNQLINMKTGDEFTISITPASDCYAYVFCYDSERNIAVLLDRLMRGGNETYLDRFVVEGAPGTDIFYVIMSLARQTRLENLIQTFKSNQSRQNGNNLYREVVNLQSTSSGLGGSASIFIAGGHTSRGNVEYVNRFFAKDMHVETINIHH